MSSRKSKASKKASKAAPKPSIPDPFEPAPPALYPLLETFDIRSVYITHIDKQPAELKKHVFYVPVALNVVLTAILLLRVYYAYPLYWKLLMSILGNANETTLYWTSTPPRTLITSILYRMCVFTFDFLLFRVVGPWPWTFFLEIPGNPVTWRWTIGFREEEVYVRESRGWGAEDLLGAAKGASGKAGGESPFFNTRILPAVDMQRLRAKTGYLLMDKDFDLFFGGMITATQLVDRKEITMDQLRTSVFVWVGNEEEGEWAVWNCGQLDEASETEARRKIVQFKDRLTLMGKESLFFKWVELVQYESNAPEGFTYERQAATAEKAKLMFAAEGVDFEKFLQEMGGLGGMPGMG
ncbi:hypothetical protein P280DRAFT_465979 [Massarina eburnea CBS 473.64]|uniref:Uncharacterized protein n=1 Tax=Massarina eburnea CBS 473.64 TaxID=1395130 RepID=A0A6A6SAA6_9PLEO|nr:hypothetical protein P280DRAFT_465979 [Massarina eburnea CBS 473.64]